MSDLARIEAFRIEDKTLDEILIYLSKWGHPRINHLKDGWYCVVNVFITSKGCEFEVKSDFDHPSPHTACTQTYERLIKAIDDLTK